MLIGRIAVLTAAAWTAACAAAERVEGRFLQRKTLGELGVAVESAGTFAFEEGKIFEMRTERPAESFFAATPSNYVFRAGKAGRERRGAFARPLKKVEEVFAVREVADLVERVESEPAEGFPRKVRVDFKNGDRLEIAFERRGAAR